MKINAIAAAAVFVSSSAFIFFPPSVAGLNNSGPRSYPRIIGGAKSQDAQVAFEAAQTAFNSSAQHLYDPTAINMVRSKNQFVVAWPDAENVVVDAKYFESKEGGDKVKSTFLQTKAIGGIRFAIRQQYMNWQGDWFDVFLVKSPDVSSKIFEVLSQPELSDKCPAGYKVVTNGTWQKPLIMRNAKNDHFIYADTGHPAEILGTWTVYNAKNDGSALELCTIEFRPQSEKISTLLPKGGLSELAILLDKIIGVPKESEGTMQSTARVKLGVAHAWGNVLFRPWAVAEPGKSRADVDALLKKWSRGSKVYAAQYSQVKPAYEKAKRQLANYYEQKFGKSKLEAQSLAAKNLDRTYRTHFSPWGV